MQLPQWLTIAVAGVVILFGVHRLRISFRSAEAEQKAVARGGLYGQRRRTHRLIGIVYLMLGAALVATSFGWNPLGRWFAPKAATRAPEPGMLAPLKPMPEAGSGSGSATETTKAATGSAAASGPATR